MTPSHRSQASDDSTGAAKVSLRALIERMRLEAAERALEATAHVAGDEHTQRDDQPAWIDSLSLSADQDYASGDDDGDDEIRRIYAQARDD